MTSTAITDRTTIGELLELVARELTVVEYTVPQAAGIVFPGMWQISLSWHSGSYSDYRFQPAHMLPPMKEIGANVEIAIFGPDGDWWLCPNMRHEAWETSQVWGWVDAPTLQRVIDRVARMPLPPGECPCPGCAAREPGNGQENA